ncbi:hypothetical protein TWF481_002703 [Arthrobotrys musiformis]|uniref:Uncharacterized protein n=1 Tax=Arthrobotrys musiformis TaxID=47236 RepID=A0AAV9VX53_9PEZI
MSSIKIPNHISDNQYLEIRTAFEPEFLNEVVKKVIPVVFGKYDTGIAVKAEAEAVSACAAGQSSGKRMLATGRGSRARYLVTGKLQCKLLVGQDILSQEDIILWPAKEMVILNNHGAARVPAITKKRHPVRGMPVRITKPTVLKPNCQQLVEVRFGTVDQYQDYQFKPDATKNDDLGIAVPHGVMSFNQTKLVVANVTGEEILLPRNRIIGTISSFDGAKFSFWAQAAEETLQLGLKNRPEASTSKKGPIQYP